MILRKNESESPNPEDFNFLIEDFKTGKPYASFEKEIQAYRLIKSFLHKDVLHDFGSDAERIADAVISSARLSSSRHGRDSMDRPWQNDAMNDFPTRAELDAKLEAIEARMDGRLARIENAVERIAEDTKQAVKQISDANNVTQEKVSSLKTTMVVTGIGTVLTVVFGIAAFNATLVSNMTSSFDSGRETAKLAAEAQTKASQAQEQTARLIAAAEVKAAQAQADTAASLAEIQKIVTELNKLPGPPEPARE